MIYDLYTYPPHLLRMREGAFMQDVADAFLKEFEAVLDVLDGDLTVDEASVTMIERLENLLKITPTDNETLDERRFAVKAKLYSRPPYTQRTFEERLNELVGTDNHEVKVDYKNNLISIGIYVPTESMNRAVQNLIDEIVPLHIRFNIYQLFNKWIQVKADTWNDLKPYTWKQIKEEQVL